MCSVCAETSSAQMNKPPESPQSPLAHGQKNMEPRYANSALSQRLTYEPRQDLPQDLAAFKKREVIRKTISALGLILIPTAFVSAIIGGGVFVKTDSQEERKRSAKWLVIAVLLMVLSSYWNELVVTAMSLLAG